VITRSINSVYDKVILKAFQCFNHFPQDSLAASTRRAKGMEERQRSWPLRPYRAMSHGNDKLSSTKQPVAASATINNTPGTIVCRSSCFNGVHVWAIAIM
jgi:hypothetical protein